jgi:hypothetical protein
MTPLETVSLIILRAEYRMLSEISEQFPVKSMHPAAKYIDKQMSIKLKEIEQLNIKKKKKA